MTAQPLQLAEEKLYPSAPRVYVRPSARAPDLLEKLCVSVFSYTGPRASPQRGRSTVRRLGVVCCVPHGCVSSVSTTTP